MTETPATGTRGAESLDAGTFEVLRARLVGQAGRDTLGARDGTHGNDHLDGGPGRDGFKADSGDVRVSVEHAAAC